MSTEVITDNVQKQVDMEPVEKLMAPPKTSSAKGSAASTKKRGRPPVKKPAPVAAKKEEAQRVITQSPLQDNPDLNNMVAPTKAPVVAVDDQAYDFSDYVHRPSSKEEMPFRPGFEGRSLFAFRYFRHDQMHQLNGSVQCGYWVPVTVSGSLLGISFTDMFVPDSDPSHPFDEHGFFPKGIVVNTAGGKRCRELYLAARPAVCTEAEKRLRAKLSAQAFNPETFAGNLSGEKLQSGENRGQSASLLHPSANPSDPYAAPVQSSQSMAVNMITSERWAGGLKNK